MGNKLTYLQAYNASSRFLDMYYWHMLPADNVAGLLGEMAFLKDGNTADPAIWDNWVLAIEKISHERNVLSSEQAFEVLIKFLEEYNKEISFADDVRILLQYLIKMQNDLEYTAWRYWRKYIKQVLNEQDSREYLMFMGKNRIDIMKDHLTYLHSYNAMCRFLVLFSKHSSAKNLESLLKRMAFLKNKKTLDSSIWSNWIESVEEIEQEKNRFTSLQAFAAMIIFLKKYYQEVLFDDDVSKLLEYLIKMQNDLQYIGWKDWQACIEYVISEEDSRIYEINV
jgi:sulfur relay (sulfurtransferase) DsrC/TusE family protein